MQKTFDVSNVSRFWFRQAQVPASNEGGFDVKGEKLVKPAPETF
jgi:hypothetical protein